MRRSSFFVVAGLVMTMFLVPQAQAEQKTIELKLAHQWPQNPEDYVVATGIKFAEQVEKQTNGQIKIKFYPAESLVKAKDIHTALQNGTIDMAIYPYIYGAGAVPELNMILLPGLWKSHDEVFAFKDGEAWKYIEQKAEAFGFKTLCWIQISGGVASKKKPIHAPSDCKGMKVRAAGKYLEYALQQLGASPLSMPSSEIYISMQQGVLDAMWTSSSSHGAFRLYEVADYYVSPEKYAFYFTIEPIAISLKTWAKLTPAQQKILLDVGKGLEQSALEGARNEDSRIAKEFAAHGAKVGQMTPAEWDQWYEQFKKFSFVKFINDIPNGKWLLETGLKLYKR